MGNERARQKKLAKQKQKRAEARKRTSMASVSVPKDSAKLAIKTAGWPVVESHLGSGWDDAESPSLVTGVIVRRGPGGVLAVGTYMADRTCLGIKSGFVRILDRLGLASMLEQIAGAHGGVEKADLLTVQSIAFHAVDYARSLGFGPDPDLPLAFLGPRPEKLLDTPFAKPARPIYLAGMDDNVDRIVAQLERVVGRGNFDVATGGDPFAGEFDEVFEGEGEGGDDEVEAQGEVIEAPKEG